MTGVERLFGLRSRRATVKGELIAGATTFATMAYVLFVNPALLSSVADRDGLSLPAAAVLTSTALVAALGCVAMGVASNLPLCLAPGMGLNAVVAFQLVAAMRLSWAEAMGVIVAEGLIITALVLTGFREAVARAIPLGLKRSIAAGIGLFLALIGLVSAGVVTRPAAGPVPVQLGDAGRLTQWPSLVFVVCLLLGAVMLARKVRGGLLLTLAVGTLLAAGLKAAGLGVWPPGAATMPATWLLAPDFSRVGTFSFSFVRVLGVASAALVVFSVMLSDFFDTLGTVVAVGQQAGYLDEKGNFPRARAVLLVDSLAAAAGGAAGASSATTYIESASGAAAGGRTGLTAVTCGALFGVCLFASPLAAVVPPQATGAVLVLVGLLMMRELAEIGWGDGAEALPAFLTLVLMPFSYSITAGIGAGFIAHVALRAASGRLREVHPLLAGCAVAFVVHFIAG